MNQQKKRFPYILNLPVNAEIWEALGSGTLDGLLTRSDVARIAMRQGLVFQGYIAPTYSQQPSQHQPNGNGGAHVASR